MSIILSRTVCGAAVAVAMATCLSGAASLAGSAPASCRVSLPITIAATHRHHSLVHTFTSGVGVSSCTGTLGPWRLGSASGWSEAHGTLGATGSGLNGANGQLVAAVPRLAFPRAPLVLFAMTMHVRSAGHILALTGSGHLVPTIRSPGTANLTASGAATLTMHSHRSGVLALQISVQSN